ncbi:hypothetical protein AB0M20_40100 [Actinoplanes sp. NPDC051633]|uniref:hypothetical protein n=1 Tax=Actinoplanes sp. NPDC051633 TaxID=3155670 RepID=UPI0034237F27
MARTGRPSGNQARETTHDNSAPPQAHPDDVALAEVMNRYDALGDDPPRFDIASNDAAHPAAHTGERHGPDVPLQRDPSGRTIEGRIYGDPPWDRAENWSYRWTDPSTMNRAVNDYVRRNWEAIRSDLALNGRHRGSFDAGHQVGEGYYNNGMYGAGPQASRYATTSFAQVRIQLVPGSNPPVPFVVTAFPSGLL